MRRLTMLTENGEGHGMKGHVVAEVPISLHLSSVALPSPRWCWYCVVNKQLPPPKKNIVAGSNPTYIKQIHNKP